MRKRPEKGQRYYCIVADLHDRNIIYRVKEHRWEGSEYDIIYFESNNCYDCFVEAELRAQEETTLQRIKDFDPRKGEVYYYIDKMGSSDLLIKKTVWTGNSDDRRRWFMQLCFPSAEDAMFYYQTFKKMVWK